MILKVFYTIFICILLAFFVGVGTAAFYKAPQYPEYPVSLKYPPPGETPVKATESSNLRAEQEKYEKISKVYEEKNKVYQRNVSIIALIAAVIMLVISLTIFRHLLVIADGLLLGGVFTLIYSMVRGFVTQDEIFRFIVISIGLAISLIIGYVKFIKPQEKKFSGKHK